MSEGNPSSINASDADRTRSPPLKRPSEDFSHHSPLRHHVRSFSNHVPVKETRNARSEYQGSQDDGTSQLRINQYMIRQEIGRGSFGAVHLATDQFGKEYAVKEFSKTRLRRRVKSNMLRQARQQQRHRFEGLRNMSWPPERPVQSPTEEEDNSFDLIKEEIAIMKKLDHGNLVSLIEVLDDPEEDSLYMVLELCKKGVVMKVEVEEPVEPYDEEQCRCWFRDLILGIEYLHAQGVIHRDIKPDNCLVTEDDTLKIVDFGVSELFEKQSEMRIAKSAGSPAFMAPELCIVKRGEVSGRAADIWSMGVTLYCLRFGRVPFQKNAVLDLYDSIINDSFELDADCNGDFTNLMCRILEKDPARRITMEELREHPWVTKNAEDPLLSAEENCANLVMPPTEEEKNAAITGNMSRLVAVMKAVHRFKGLLEKRRPDLFEGFLDQASRIVQPPLVMARANQDLNAQLSRSAADVPGDQQSDIGRLVEQFKSSVVSSVYGSQTEKPSTEPSSTSQTPAAGTSTEPGSQSNLDGATPTLDRKDSVQGQAHDPLEDHFFLDIGTGPSSDDAVDTPVAFMVSESPPPAGYNVYEEAYKDEVDRIMKKNGNDTTIYSTRRAEGQHIQATDKDGQGEASRSFTPRRKSDWGDLFGRAVNKSTQAATAAYESMHK